MDKSCLDYCLSEEERLQFEQEGYFICKDVLPRNRVVLLNAIVDLWIRPEMEDSTCRIL